MCGPGQLQVDAFSNGGLICGFTVCPQESIFHYYYCCYGLFGGCCFYLRTWVIVLLIVFGIALLLCGAAAVFVVCSRNRQQRPLAPTEHDAHYYTPREHTVYYTDHSRDRSL